jgi:hypothetical protein
MVGTALSISVVLMGLTGWLYSAIVMGVAVLVRDFWRHVECPPFSGGANPRAEFTACLHTPVVDICRKVNRYFRMARA